jgi:hypothetical protein
MTCFYCENRYFLTQNAGNTFQPWSQQLNESANFVCIFFFLLHHKKSVTNNTNFGELILLYQQLTNYMLTHKIMSLFSSWTKIISSGAQYVTLQKYFSSSNCTVQDQNILSTAGDALSSNAIENRFPLIRMSNIHVWTMNCTRCGKFVVLEHQH